MSKHRCGECGGRGGIAGACPECGELPVVELVGASRPAPGDERRVTTPPSARRAAVVAAAVVVALLGLSLVWGAGAAEEDGVGAADEVDDVGAATSSTTRARRSPTTLTDPPRPPETGEVPLVEPVPGFENQWLVVVSTPAAVWQLPLGGGEAVRLGTLGAHMHPQFLVGHHLVGPDGGMSLRDGSQWSAMRAWNAARADSDGFPGAQWAYVVGVMGSERVLVYDERSFAELLSDGTFIAEHAALGRDSLGSYPRAVVGDHVIFEGVHGILTLDLDSGVRRRLAVGTLIATAGDHAVVDVCDDSLRCGIRVIDLPDGRVVTEGIAGPQPGSPPPVWMSPSVSPDGQRLLMTGDVGVLTVVDLETGRQHVVALPEALAGDSLTQMVVHAVWAADSSAVLVFATRHGGGSREERGVQYAAWIDRDGVEVGRRDDLVAALEPLALHVGMIGIFTSDEAFEPW